MGRLVAAVVVVLALGASSAHASVVVTESVDEQWQQTLRVDATAIEGADLRITAGPDGRVVIDAGDAEVEPWASVCHPDSGGNWCWTRAVEVVLGDGGDRVALSGVWAGSVDGGGGNDVIRAETPYEWVYDGGPGRDRLELSGHGGAGITMWAAASEWGAVERIERVTLTEHADWVSPDPGQEVELGAGDDTVYAADGADQVIDCGPGVDRADADAADRLTGCEHVLHPYTGGPWTESSPWFPMPLPYVPPQAGAGPLGIQGTPKLEGDRFTVALRALFANQADLEVRVGPWRGDVPAAVLPVASAPVPLRDGGRVSFAFSVPPELMEVARRDGRLRVHGVLKLHGRGSETVREGRFTLVVPRASRVVLDGRRRKGSFGRQTMRGGPLGDLMSAESADDRLFGFDGTDALHGGTGNDALHGGNGDDLLDGGDGDDTVYGEAGDDDIIEARFGNDTLDGGPGDDVVHGRRGTDTIRGGEGDDVIDGGSGLDRVDCGPGEDIVLVNTRSERTVNCEEIHQGGEGVVHRRCERGGTDEPETVLGTEGDDRCAGRGGDDDVEGRGGDDLLEGGTGNDRIFGRFGIDVLRGDDGDDELEGGRGRDRLDGGAGNDQLNGGYHRDRVAGGDGDDRVIARGGGTDRIDCGPGNDIAYVDSRDRVRGCERVRSSGARKSHR